MIDWLWVQKRLKQLGLDPGPTDGKPGPRTDAAIVAFKRAHGLRPRPYVGPITLRALHKAKRTGDIPWMEEAIAVRGLHEARDRNKLAKWFDKSVAWIDPRRVAWCGAFVATVMRRWKIVIRVPDNPLGARQWAKFGKPCPPGFGAVLVFWRVSPTDWRGHVGLYWGEDKTHFHVLGGNQANAVTVTRIAKTRLLAARWPANSERKPRRVLLTSGGVPVSENEA